MSIAILSIPLGIISIIIFIWSMNAMSDKPAKGKKKDNDSSLIGIIASVVIFFVALGIYDGKESTGDLFSSDEPSQERSYQSGGESKNNSDRALEEHNKEAMEKAAKNSGNESVNLKDAQETTRVDGASQNKNLEAQQKAFEKWYLQLDAKLETIETSRSALWSDNSKASTEKLLNVLETSKLQLAEIKIPDELSAFHKQKLSEAMKRYDQWLDSYKKACQMRLAGNDQQNILSEVARGDGLKMQSNIEIGNVGRELGLAVK